MKKLALLLLVIFSVMAVLSCDSEEKEELSSNVTFSNAIIKLAGQPGNSLEGLQLLAAKVECDQCDRVRKEKEIDKDLLEAVMKAGKAVTKAALPLLAGQGIEKAVSFASFFRYAEVHNIFVIDYIQMYDVKTFAELQKLLGLVVIEREGNYHNDTIRYNSAVEAEEALVRKAFPLLAGANLNEVIENRGIFELERSQNLLLLLYLETYYQPETMDEILATGWAIRNAEYENHLSDLLARRAFALIPDDGDLEKFAEETERIENSTIRSYLVQRYIERYGIVNMDQALILVKLVRDICSDCTRETRNIIFQSVISALEDMEVTKVAELAGKLESSEIVNDFLGRYLQLCDVDNITELLILEEKVEKERIDDFFEETEGMIVQAILKLLDDPDTATPDTADIVKLVKQFKNPYGANLFLSRYIQKHGLINAGEALTLQSAVRDCKGAGWVSCSLADIWRKEARLAIIKAIPDKKDQQAMRMLFGPFEES